MDITTFMNMDGYAPYVWGSYGVALISYAALIIRSLIVSERFRKQAREKLPS